VDQALLSLAVVGVVVCIVVLIVLFDKKVMPNLIPPAKPLTPVAQQLAQRYNNVHLMSGPKFEYFAADLFEAMGYRASVLGGAGDQGVDILLTGGDQRIAVQCKNFAKPVGNKPVQEVYAGATYHGATRAWVVAPRGYTSGAVELARRLNVELYDGHHLWKWIDQMRVVQGTAEGDEATQVQTTTEETAADTQRQGYTPPRNGGDARNSAPKRDESTLSDNELLMGLDGRGSTAIELNLAEGLRIFTYSYKDEGENPGHFSLDLLDNQGYSVNLIANRVGTTSGSKGVRAPYSGRYVMNVTADQGSWSLEVK
jgi:hypothetical protein